jgi:CubicO group peptidase (beta-lactamase class C family)
MRQPALLFVVLTVFLMAGATGPTAARTPSVHTPDYASIDAFVRTEMAANHIPGLALAIVQGDQIVHLKGFGAADPAGRAVTPQTSFMIGSLSKSFTALAVMQLAQAHQLDLDQPVQRYLPWFQVADREASARITLRELLNQTSGLTRRDCEQADQLGRGAGALEQNVRALAHTALSAPPGTRYQYCNTNYQVLGLLVETASGQSYADYVRDHIFQPLDMPHSFASRAAAEAGGMALGYRLTLAVPVPAYDRPYAEGDVPSGGLIVSAEDMAHYLIAHLNRGNYQDQNVLSAGGMQALHQPPNLIPGANYAMGWAAGSYDGYPVLTHNGAVPDFSSEMWLLPNQGYGVVVLENVHSNLFTNRMGTIGLAVVSQLLGLPAPAVQPDTQAWVALGILALMVVWQIISLAGGRQLIRNRRVRSAGWWLALVLAAILDVAVVILCLDVIPASAQSALRVMWVFSPDLTLLLLALAGLSIIWGLARTLLALHPQPAQRSEVTLPVAFHR